MRWLRISAASGAWTRRPRAEAGRRLPCARSPCDRSACRRHVSAHLLTKTPPDVGAAVYSSDSAKDPRFDHPLLRLLPHRSVLIQPMRIRGEIAGILAFVWTRSRHRFNDIELRLVDAVTQQAANAIENAELLSEVRELNEHLERRVRDRTSQLNAGLRRAARLTRGAARPDHASRARARKRADAHRARDSRRARSGAHQPQDGPGALVARQRQWRRRGRVDPAGGGRRRSTR